MMKNSTRNLISFILGCLALLLIPFITMLFILIYDYSSHSDLIKIIVTALIVIFLASIFSFLICIFSPKNIGYTPIIVNLGSLLTALYILSSYWTLSAKLIVVIVSIIFSYIFGWLGSNIGIRIMNK
jgi:hypothetical protein